jgi:predicted nucleic acid-binding protein
MTVYPDTSFLCALYRQQDNSKQADALFNSLTSPLTVAALVIFEFRQSVRFQTFLHHKDGRKGYSQRQGSRMLADLRADLSAGRLQIAAIDWAKVISAAEQLSAQFTSKGGYRGFDILHVATALELEAGEFLSFDTRQCSLARAVGLKTRP